MSALKGKTIVVTSDIKKAKKLEKLLQRHEAQIVKFPLIKISGATHLCKESLILNLPLENIHWVVFSSSNSVQYFFEWLKKQYMSPKDYNWKYAVIGKATAGTLERGNIRPDFISRGTNAEEFAYELLDYLKPTPKQILISSGNRSSDTLPKLLNSRHQCHKIITYQTEQIKYSDSEIKSLMNNRDYDIVFFMSPSTVESFYAHNNTNIMSSHLKTAVIGTTTHEALLMRGVHPDFMPSRPNLEIFVDELAKFFENNQAQYNN
jgi:uroporphyrinogen III methyltransferase/synthase